ncbi:MAG: ABC transporter permease subunit [Bacteroidota bacterium]
MRFWGMFRFTILETVRKGTLIFYFAVATFILLLLTLGISRSPNDPELITMFGIPFGGKPIGDLGLVEFLLYSLHHLSVQFILLFGIFGVSGLIPDMLEKGTIDLFLSKPLTRMELLLSRSFGATAGIGLNLVYFFAGVWAVFGLKIGVWHWAFLSSLVYVFFAFACFYSVVTIVGLITRSTGFTVLISFCFLFISWGLEVREHGLYLLWNNTAYHRLLDALYYLTPQLNAMLENSSRVIIKAAFFPGIANFTIMPYLYSLGSAVLLYALSVWYFSRRDF